MTPGIDTWAVTSGWQFRVHLDGEDYIVGGWAPTENAAERRATEVLDR